MTLLKSGIFWISKIWEREQMKSVQSSQSLAPSKLGHISFVFKLHLKLKEWNSTQPGIVNENTMDITFKFNGISLKLIVWALCHLILLQHLKLVLQNSPFWYWSNCWIYTTQEDNDKVIYRNKELLWLCYFHWKYEQWWTTGMSKSNFNLLSFWGCPKIFRHVNNLQLILHQNLLPRFNNLIKLRTPILRATQIPPPSSSSKLSLELSTRPWT